jgi:beta-glucosidase
MGIGWEDALAQAEAFLAKLTLEEKAGLVTGMLCYLYSFCQ